MQNPSIPISRIGGSYYLFHGPHVARVRREYGIAGILTGTLPQASQQNLFLGLPLQLMHEEARLLCEMGVAFVVDDQTWHYQCMRELERDSHRRNQWMQSLEDIGLHVSREVSQQKETERQRATAQMSEKAKHKKNKRAKDKDAKLVARRFTVQDTNESLLLEDLESSRSPSSTPLNLDESLDTRPEDSQHVLARQIEAYTITPTTSHPLLPIPMSSLELPSVPSSYALFKFLHARSYFLSPGLRFGCQYMAYPGDPLRFHSHFMVVGRDWEEEVELLTLIGLGRLGTGVKKGVLIGGSEKTHGYLQQSFPASTKDRKAAIKAESNEGDEEEQKQEQEQEQEKEERVRCFTIEWGGM
ncbi:MAG: hypothetical protein Q9162_000323 [Coniocarpon cinnabarinum]